MTGDGSSTSGDPHFLTTRWSLVRSAAGRRDVAARSLEELCRAYWYPLYAYLRRRGTDRASSEDLVQAFFALILERGDLGAADPERGRCRGWLLTALKHFALNERERENALKRGGGQKLLSIDWDAAEQRYTAEPSTDRTPEREFDRAWALATLERATERLREEYDRRGRPELFAALRPQLSAGTAMEDRDALAARLGLTQGALKVAIHRLRQRFGEALRAEIGETLESPESIDTELAELLEALGA